eukprot:GEMP01018507.1.p1 GENE.GEMP01018507.1~~GEMP01018507.1.p1  ORF type:complete len:606 (+),score=105.79 GEMP01018507.1:53-1819(+)
MTIAEIRFPFQSLDPDKLVSTTFRVSFEDIRKPGFDVAINTSALYQSLTEFAVVVNKQQQSMHRISNDLDESVTQITRTVMQHENLIGQCRQLLTEMTATFNTKLEANVRRAELAADVMAKKYNELLRRAERENPAKDVEELKLLLDQQNKEITNIAHRLKQNKEPCKCETRQRDLERRVSALERAAMHSPSFADLRSCTERVECRAKTQTTQVVSVMATMIRADTRPVSIAQCVRAWAQYSKHRTLKLRRVSFHRQQKRIVLSCCFAVWKQRPAAVAAVVNRLKRRLDGAANARLQLVRNAFQTLRQRAKEYALADFIQRSIPPTVIHEVRDSMAWEKPMLQLQTCIADVAQRITGLETKKTTREEQSTEEAPEKLERLRDVLRADLRRRIDAVDNRLSDWIRATDVVMRNAREVFSCCLDSIKNFTVRQGPPCLSCGQALSAAGGLVAPPNGIECDLVVSSPDVLSVAFCHNLLSLLLAVFGKVRRPQRKSANGPPDDNEKVHHPKCLPSGTWSLVERPASKEDPRKWPAEKAVIVTPCVRPKISKFRPRPKSAGLARPSIVHRKASTSFGTPRLVKTRCIPAQSF